MKSKKPIYEAWLIQRNFLPLTLSEVEVERLRKAFYAGAFAAYTCVEMVKSGKLPTEKAMAKIMKEMREIEMELNAGDGERPATN